MIGHLLGAAGGVEAVATVQVKTIVPLVYEFFSSSRSASQMLMLIFSFM